MEIPDNLRKEIEQYCRVNNISNIDEFTLKLIKQGFTMEKFGATPATTIVEKEVEKIVEVPVEKIVEKIVEVQVEKIVEKEVYITDDKQTKDLLEKVVELESVNKLQFKNLTDKIADSMKNADHYKNEMERFQKELNNTLQKLEIEQKKNNKDIYGEN